MGSYDTPGGAYSVAISGAYAYVADDDSGLWVVGICDPVPPVLVGSNDAAIHYDVHISGNHAYVAANTMGLVVFDVSDPTSPTWVGYYDPLSGLGSGVTTSGDYAYLCNSASGLLVIDISDPTTPSLAGSYDTPHSAYDVAISGDYAFVADYSSLQVIDISDPTSPDSAGSYDTPISASDVAISVADSSGAGPNYAVFVVTAHTTTAASWNDPEYDGWDVYYKITACDFVGNESDPASAGTATAVTKPVIPQTYALCQNVPNPFNPTTTIRYDVPTGGGKVTLRIYDVSGRLVRTLVDKVQMAGEKQAVWYGRNRQGNRVATGVYFYRMTAPGFVMTRKMVLLQ